MDAPTYLTVLLSFASFAAGGIILSLLNYSAYVPDVRRQGRKDNEDIVSPYPPGGVFAPPEPLVWGEPDGDGEFEDCTDADCDCGGVSCRYNGYPV